MKKNNYIKLGLQYFADGVKSLDVNASEQEKIKTAMADAVMANDKEAFGEAFSKFADGLQQKIIAEAKALAHVTDTSVLAQRGVRQLTKEENYYFTKLSDAMQSSTPQAAISNIDIVLPETEINEIFNYLKENHPLLDLVDFTNTGAALSWITSSATGVSAWGGLCEKVESELGGAFTELNMTLYSLAAYFPVCKAMLKLGPTWLERWVREVLAEAIAVGAEKGIVDGDGKSQPLGMTRALTGATDGVYPRKTAVKLTELTPTTLSPILQSLATGPNSKSRQLNNVIFVVNPKDYFTKIYPATTVRTTDGSWNTNVLPFPMTVVQSSAVPDGHAVIGLAKEYFFGLGTAKGGNIEYSDEYKFLERQRIYLAELYGNGRPKDANAFEYVDISELVPTVKEVKVINTGEVEG